MGRAPIQQGQIFWLECPPLDGGEAKVRPHVLIATESQIASGGMVLLVACTTTPEREAKQDEDKVELPSLARDPRAWSKLSERTWALPRWRRLMEQERLIEWSGGYVGGLTVRRLQAAVKQRIIDELEK